MNLNDWLDAVISELDLDPIDSARLLDLARDVAHGVARPAAPLTCYLVGVAAGRGDDLGQAIDRVLGLIPPEAVLPD